MKIMWTRQEPGWYTSELGGICQEAIDRWVWYPAREGAMRWRFWTLEDAQWWAEACANLAKG